MKEAKNEFTIRKITPSDNPFVAALVRSNLEKHGLNIPGTAYFDPVLDNLCGYYCGGEARGYYVLEDGRGCALGGIGFDAFPPIKGCAELQKLYLDDRVKGKGLGYKLISFIEERMREKGYKAVYLETHRNLQAAIHIYEKSGYIRIERPEAVVHGTMDHFYYKTLS